MIDPELFYAHQALSQKTSCSNETGLSFVRLSNLNEKRKPQVTARLHAL
jgi:hypothetical protein